MEGAERMLKRIRNGIASRLAGGVAVLMLLTAAGCATSQKTASSGTGNKDGQAAPLYYDFEDVLIPRELKLDTESTFIYHSSGLTAGVLVFKADVDRNSLIQFFENNMTKDNWQYVSSFKSPRTLLLFKKENRWCVINITDNKWETWVEIWVAPFSDSTGSGLLK